MPTLTIEMPDWVIAQPRDKLTDDQRFAIYALKYKRGVSAKTLAKTFDVSVVTIYKVTSQKLHPTTKPGFGTYRKAYIQAKTIGLDQMYNDYVTDDMLRSCAGLPALPHKAVGRPAGPTASRPAAGGASPDANSARGLHELPSNFPAGGICTAEVDWVEEGSDYGSADGENSEPGWYYRFPRHSDSRWRGNGEDGSAFADSDAALGAANSPIAIRRPDK